GAHPLVYFPVLSGGRDQHLRAPGTAPFPNVLSAGPDWSYRYPFPDRNRNLPRNSERGWLAAAGTGRLPLDPGWRDLALFPTDRMDRPVIAALGMPGLQKSRPTRSISPCPSSVRRTTLSGLISSLPRFGADQEGAFMNRRVGISLAGLLVAGI